MDREDGGGLGPVYFTDQAVPFECMMRLFPDKAPASRAAFGAAPRVRNLAQLRLRS